MTLSRQDAAASRCLCMTRSEPTRSHPGRTPLRASRQTRGCPPCGRSSGVSSPDKPDTMRHPPRRNIHAPAARDCLQNSGRRCRRAGSEGIHRQARLAAGGWPGLPPPSSGGVAASVRENERSTGRGMTLGRHWPCPDACEVGVPGPIRLKIRGLCRMPGGSGRFAPPARPGARFRSGRQVPRGTFRRRQRGSQAPPGPRCP